MRQIKIKVLANSIDRIDQYIINQIKEQHEDLTRSKLKKLLLKNKLLLNGETIKKFTQKLNLNDEITIIIDEAVESDIMANNIEIDSIYEENDIIIINKQKNLQTHPGGKNRQNTLVNALLYHYHDQLSGIGGVIRPGIVHRLDKNTTGLMVIAKNDFAHIKISEQLQNRSLKRTYLALTFAVPSKLKDNIETFIEIHPTKRSLRRISKKNGKKAITFYEVIEKYYEQNLTLFIIFYYFFVTQIK